MYFKGKIIQGQSKGGFIGGYGGQILQNVILYLVVFYIVGEPNPESLSTMLEHGRRAESSPAE